MNPILRILPAAAVLALAACNGDSTRPGDEFVANRVVARVQKAESGEELKLDAELMGLHVASALDASRAFTLLLGGDMLGGEMEMGPMMELFIPGPLAARSYPVGVLDINADEPPAVDGLTTALAMVVAPEDDGDDMDFFSTTGGSVDVVSAAAASGRTPGHVRARVALDLREFYFDREPITYGKRATGKGSLDGPVMHTLASDAEVAFTGAFTGSTRRDLFDGMFGGSPDGREWSFFVGTGGRDPYFDPYGQLSLALSRTPRAGETLRFAAVAPDSLFGPGAGSAPDTSAAFLYVSGGATERPDTLSRGGTLYLSTAGEFRVEAATADALRGTLTLTLAEYDLRTRTFGARRVTAAGRVGLSMSREPVMFGRAPSLQTRRAAHARVSRALAPH